MLHAHQGVTGVERDALLMLVRQMESFASGDSLVSLKRIQSLLRGSLGKAMGVEGTDNRSAS